MYLRNMKLFCIVSVAGLDNINERGLRESDKAKRRQCVNRFLWYATMLEFRREVTGSH